ncbi:hypothetical protein SAMCFNEI73_Ch0498 [Sinorhizobium americanum]|uniref:Uncharacterized protein n=1 Tax=Sinorhizobium americanum TaxID=194963 RepID=A0A1L3LIC6_9HYPH|nr:hypothetical protein SAMCCGM7_Ch0500 [Sinorhizobium americanum CCGM7]APG89828.1 hypothetical protein SAMCFNEI73_Ch0498 [Sinorhizobium americanum]
MRNCTSRDASVANTREGGAAWVGIASSVPADRAGHKVRDSGAS